MDGPRNCSKSEKDKYHMISRINGIQNITQMNISTKHKQTQGHGDQTCGCQGGRGWGRDGIRD